MKYMTSWNKSGISSGVSRGLDTCRESSPGSHCIIVYPDLMTLRGVYSHYTKMQLEQSKEIVLILPYYENTEMVRLTLSGETIYDESGNNPFGYSGIDVNKYEKEGSLIIMDSLEGYFPSKRQSVFNNDIPDGHLDFMSYLEILLKQAERQKKNGVTVLADMGSFHHHNNPDGNLKLIEYECSLPKKFDAMNLKGFCLYHQKDFEKRFSQEEQIELLRCHSSNIIVENDY
jgi:MEDS: MEthanogen/methylotroph, DcmR Sensory domain